MTKEQKFLLLAVLIIAGASTAFYYTQSSPVPTAVVPTPTQPTTTNQNPSIPARSFSVDTTYATPEDGHETIHVTISLSGDTIQDIAFSYDTPNKRESKENITNFERAFNDLSLKGKSLAGVSLSRIGGASLTTNAFMEAVGKIRLQSTNG
jgi:uncharacterized protein with FMN-binding domain